MKGTMLELLTWAYRDELPKRDVQGFGDGWGAVEAAGERGGWDAPPTARLPTILGAPHADAELVDRRVKAMAPFRFLRQGVDPIEERRGLARHFLGPMAWAVEDARLALLTRPLDLRPFVQSLALGALQAPAREAWAPERILADEATGRVLQVGVEWRTTRVKVGGVSTFLKEGVAGLCPIRWTPDPAGTLFERLRWAGLCQALEAVMGELGGLILWRIDGLGLPLEPWRGDVHRRLVGVLLPDLGAPLPAPVDWRTQPRKRGAAASGSNSAKSAKVQRLGP
jgi:hypothetical protein